MNPEEGLLRPQIQDRFGLRVLVRGVTDLEERKEIYRRSVAYKTKPYRFVLDWVAETEAAGYDVIEARKLLSKVTLTSQAEEEGLRWIGDLKIDSHRAEMTLFEAGRALAAADGRLEVTLDDLKTVAPLALRQRQTVTASEFFDSQIEEDKKIKSIISKAPISRTRKKRAKKSTRSPKSSVKAKAASKNGPSSKSETASADDITESSQAA